MKNTVLTGMLLLLIALASIVPWADAQQKPSNVLIWCQNTNGTSSPCIAGNALDYDTGAGTVNQSTIGLVVPGSGGPVAAGTATNPIRTDPTGTNPQPVTQSGSWSLAANQSVNMAQINGVTPLMGAGTTGTGSPRVTEATDSQLSAGVGATGDAAATVGSTGSLTAKLRLITSQLDAIQTAVQTIDNMISGVGVNISQINGVAPSMGNGVSGTGVPRVTIASDSTGTVAATQSGTWTVQPGNTANTTPWLTSPVPATSGGTSVCYIASAATTNATNCKALAGQIYGYELINTTATLYYLRLYNLSAAPTCSSATGFIRTIPIPAAATGAGVSRSIAVGEAYGTGIGFCLTGGGSSTDNTSAATGVYVSINYK